MTCGELACHIPSRILIIKKKSANIGTKFACLRTCFEVIHSRWNFCSFHAVWESIHAKLEPVKLKRSITGKYTDHAGFPSVLNALCSKWETINTDIVLSSPEPRLKSWAYSIPMVRHPSIVVHTFKLEYLWSQLANLDQILCVASLGWRKGCIRFWGDWVKTLVSMATESPFDL